MIRDSFIAFDEYVCQPDPGFAGFGLNAYAYSSDALAARLGYYDKLALHAVVDTTPPGTGTATLRVDVEHSADGVNWVYRATAISDGTVHRNNTDAFFGYVPESGIDNILIPLLPLVRLKVTLTGSSFAEGHVRIYANVRDPSD